jgi:hypothetical protein
MADKKKKPKKETYPVDPKKTSRPAPKKPGKKKK